MRREWLRAPSCHEGRGALRHRSSYEPHRTLPDETEREPRRLQCSERESAHRRRSAIPAQGSKTPASRSEAGELLVRILSLRRTPLEAASGHGRLPLSPSVG
eukprot:11341802-Alexandrium_andersonii.AAC.1